MADRESPKSKMTKEHAASRGDMHKFRGVNKKNERKKRVPRKPTVGKRAQADDPSGTGATVSSLFTVTLIELMTISDFKRTLPRSTN